MPGFTHEEAFPIVAKAILAAIEQNGSANRSETERLMLSDEVSAQAIIDAANSYEHPKPPEKVARNMLAWFSAKFKQTEYQPIREFVRQFTRKKNQDGTWEYLKNGTPVNELPSGEGPTIEKDFRGNSNGPKLSVLDERSHVIMSQPKIALSAALQSSEQIGGAINQILSFSGSNRLPEGLEVFHQIPLTLMRIAKSIDQADWETLIQYIQELEEQNTKLAAELADTEKKTLTRIWLEESAKTAGGWKAWAALVAGVTLAASSFGYGQSYDLADRLEEISPPVCDDAWPLVDI